MAGNNAPAMNMASPTVFKRAGLRAGLTALLALALSASDATSARSDASSAEKLTEAYKIQAMNLLTPPPALPPPGQCGCDAFETAAGYPPGSNPPPGVHQLPHGTEFVRVTAEEGNLIAPTNVFALWVAWPDNPNNREAVTVGAIAYPVGTGLKVKVVGNIGQTAEAIDTTPPGGACVENWSQLYEVSAPLPIELVSFTADQQDGSFHLRRTTTTEQENKGFEVEASGDGKTWEVFDFVPARGDGTSTTPQEYEYSLPVDAVADEDGDGVIYFRFKQVDHNGDSSYSPVVSGKLPESKNSSVTLFPNPCRDVLNIRGLGENAPFQVISLSTGRVVHGGKPDGKRGDRQVDMTNHPAGIYLLRTTGVGGTTSMKFTKI